MLTGKQKRHLRALGHNLKAFIQIGKKEIEDGLINETNAALDHHELVKVKLLESCMLDRSEASILLAEACSADVAQILGRTFLLYRPAKEPVINFNNKDRSTAAPKPASTAKPNSAKPAKKSRSGQTTRSSSTRRSTHTTAKPLARKP